MRMLAVDDGAAVADALAGAVAERPRAEPGESAPIRPIARRGPAS